MGSLPIEVLFIMFIVLVAPDANGNKSRNTVMVNVTSVKVQEEMFKAL